MNKPKIPFGMMPGHWGLKGKTREIARAEYELEGLELDLRLAEINHDDIKLQNMAKLVARLKHKDIELYDYDVAYNKIRLEGDSLLEEVLLDLELKHHRISQQEHDRKLADLRGEPWVAMPDVKWDPSDPSRSYFELDYNEHFVVFLRNNGYQGASDDLVVDRWLNDVCRSVAGELMEEDPGFVTPAPVRRKKPRGKKGTTEYS